MIEEKLSLLRKIDRRLFIYYNTKSTVNSLLEPKDSSLLNFQIPEDISQTKKKLLNLCSDGIDNLLKKRETIGSSLFSNNGISVFNRDEGLIKYFEDKRDINFKPKYFAILENVTRKEFAKILRAPTLLEYNVMRLSRLKRLKSKLPKHITPSKAYISQYNYKKGENKRVVIATNFYEVLCVILNDYLLAKQNISDKN